MTTEEAFERAKETIDARLKEMGSDLKAVVASLGIETDLVDQQLNALTVLALADDEADVITQIGGLTRVCFLLGHEVGRLEREG